MKEKEEREKKKVGHAWIREGIYWIFGEWIMMIANRGLTNCLSCHLVVIIQQINHSDLLMDY